MKKIVFSTFLALLLLAGCSQENSLVGPQEQSNKTWLKVPAKSDMSVETQYTTGKIVYGNWGGELKLSSKYFWRSNNKIEVEAELEIPAHAFDGLKIISMTLDDQTASATFNPSPFIFDKPLSFSLSYDGLDLRGVNPSEIQFCYLADDGQLVPAKNDGVTVDVKKGKLSVKNAVVPHFSRYGFVK